MEYLCNICKQKIKLEDKEKHELICANSIRPDEFQNLIPCEYCDNLVNVEDYMEHVNMCYKPNISVPNFFDFLRSPQINNNNVIEITDDSINELFNLLSNINNLENDNYSELTNLSEEIGNVEMGLENFDDKLIKKNVDNFKCLICYTNSDSCVETKCNHQFCYECAKNWFKSNKKCPICNQELE